MIKGNVYFYVIALIIYYLLLDYINVACYFNYLWYTYYCLEVWTMSNKNFGFALVIMIPIAVGLFIYGVSTYKTGTVQKDKNVIDNEVEYNEDDENGNTDLDIYSRDVQNLISFIFKNNQNIYIRNGSDSDDYFYKNKTIEVTNIDMNDKLMIAVNSLTSSSSIKESDLEKAFIKIFGSEEEFQPMDFSGICESYTYNSKNHNFVRQEENCDQLNDGSMSKVYQAIRTVLDDDTYIDIYEYYAKEVINEDNNKYSYYSDYLGSKSIIKNSNDQYSIDQLIDSYDKQLGIYKYRFKLVDNNYIFTEVSRIK